MASALMSDLTRMLDAAAAGDRRAAAELLPLDSDGFLVLAAARMAAVGPDHTLSAKALVHEAYHRLFGDAGYDNRGHFFAAGAGAMRRVPVIHARDHARPGREGSRVRVGLLDHAGASAEDPDPVPWLDRTPRGGVAASVVSRLHRFGGRPRETSG